MSEEAKNNDNLVDVAMRLYNGVQGIMTLWVENSSLVFTADVVKGDQFVTDESIRFNPPSDLPEPTIKKREVATQFYSVIKGQGLVDIAIQEYGSIEGLEKLMELNTSITSPDYVPTHGELLVIDTKATNISKKKYIQDRNVIIATGFNISYSPVGKLWITGTGAFITGSDNKPIKYSNG